MVFQCKNYSEITVETRTQLKSVIFTTDIFAVQKPTAETFSDTPLPGMNHINTYP